MFDITTKNLYTAICASRHERNVSCSKNYLLFSSCQTPVIYDFKTNEVVTFLLGHANEVNGQCFVLADQEEFIISTSYDKSAIIWRFYRDNNENASHEIIYKLLSDDEGFFTTRCSMIKDKSFISITSTIEGSIYLWKNDILIQKLKTKHCYFDAKIASLEKGLNFVFLAASDNKIHVYHLNQNALELILELSGHSDWIKSLDLLRINGGYMLASASQDSFIRVWHLKIIEAEHESSRIRTCVSPKISSADYPSRQFRLTATLETVLAAHEDIVHGLSWFQNLAEPIIQLVTCSADKTISIWKSTLTAETTNKPQKLNKYEQCPATAEIWKETYRFGETGETNLPFLGVCVSPDQTTIFAHSLHGAIHSLKYDEGVWKARHTITGHFGPVTDLSWEKSGAFLLSVSLDKTCRLHAIVSETGKWSELARPQVHGHELNCLASLEFTRFATGAEEKTIRVFEATQFFIKNFEALAKTDLPKDLEVDVIGKLPVHAQLPALGLSNRGAKSPYDLGDVNDENSSNNNWYKVSELVTSLIECDHLNSLPREEILLQSTLWWETNKSYGHGNELHALTSDSLGSYIASASKANRLELANVLVWECSKFRKVASIEHHTLTVTRLRFSPNDRYLLSVSRDRTWCISEKTGNLRQAYKKLFGTSKSNASHERIIWDCCWTYDSEFFMTVSRDKKAILWCMEELTASSSQAEQERQLNYLTSKTFDSSIQAVDSPDCQIFTKPNSSTLKRYFFALAFENGTLELYSIFTQDQKQWELLSSFNNFHQLPIRRISFQPSKESRQDESLLLASAGDDSTVKLTRLDCNYASETIGV